MDVLTILIQNYTGNLSPKHENISEGKLFDRTSLKDMQYLYAWVKNHLGITSSDLCIIDEDYIRHKLVIDEPRFDYYAF